MYAEVVGWIGNNISLNCIGDIWRKCRLKIWELELLDADIDYIELALFRG